MLQGVLPLGALGVVEDLLEGGLADIQVGIPLQMVRPYLLMSFVINSHANSSCLAVKTMFARTVTSCPDRDVGSATDRAGGAQDGQEPSSAC